MKKSEAIFSTTIKIKNFPYKTKSLQHFYFWSKGALRTTIWGFPVCELQRWYFLNGSDAQKIPIARNMQNLSNVTFNQKITYCVIRTKKSITFYFANIFDYSIIFISKIKHKNIIVNYEIILSQIHKLINIFLWSYI